MKRLLLLTIIAILGCVNVTYAAPSATIKKAWIEHGVKEDGHKAIKVHCDFTVKDMADQFGYMRIWVKGPSGKWQTLSNASKTKSGKYYFSQKFKVKLNSEHFKDLDHTVLLNDLNMSPGKNEYKVIVSIHSKKGTKLAQSDPVTFKGTGKSKRSTSDKKTSKTTPKKDKSKKGSDIVDVHCEYLPGGGMKEITKYSNGASKETLYSPCASCRGTKLCNMCGGQKTCTFCGGTGSFYAGGYGGPLTICGLCDWGICRNCKGTGECFCAHVGDYPGYIPWSTTHYDANGLPFHHDKYGSYDSDSHKSDGKDKQTCPDCGGTKMWNRGTQPEYAEPSSIFLAYLNASGHVCPYCGYADKHFHSKCITCMRMFGTSNRDNPYE